MNDVIVRCTPRLYYWFIGILLYPVASFVFTAVLIRPLFLLFGSDLQRQPLILTWILVTAIVAAWAYIRDYRRLCYTLSSGSLTVRRGTAATHIPFADIKSIVLALPERLPWWLRIQRFNPKGRGLYRNVLRARELTILLRLNDGRYLPLNLAYTFLANGQQFMAELLRLNQSRIVGHETYTENEIRGLASAQFNTLKTIDANS